MMEKKVKCNICGHVGSYIFIGDKNSDVIWQNRIDENSLICSCCLHSGYYDPLLIEDEF